MSTCPPVHTYLVTAKMADSKANPDTEQDFDDYVQEMEGRVGQLEEMVSCLNDTVTKLFTRLDQVEKKPQSANSDLSHTKSNEYTLDNPPKCCEQNMRRLTVRKEGKNKGRFFWTCCVNRQNHTGSFRWCYDRTPTPREIPQECVL